MAYSKLVKEIAYALDPEAFVSYSGTRASYKAKVDRHRNSALEQAQRIVDANPQPIQYIKVPVEKGPDSDYEAAKHVAAGLDMIEEAVNKRKGWIANRIEQIDELIADGKELVHIVNAFTPSFQRDRLIRDRIVEIANKAR